MQDSGMLSFHFNVLGSVVQRDLEGAELPDITATECKARRHACRMLFDGASPRTPTQLSRPMVSSSATGLCGSRAGEGASVLASPRAPQAGSAP